jgi:hypothetical protein
MATLDDVARMAAELHPHVADGGHPREAGGDDRALACGLSLRVVARRRCPGQVTPFYGSYPAYSLAIS